MINLNNCHIDKQALNAAVTFLFDARRDETVELEICDLLGREVRYAK